MKFEWNEIKNQINLHQHGYSFQNAHKVFDGPMLIDLDDRFDYGEDRWIGIGRLQLQIVVVVYTEQDDETIRIISLRKALKHERNRYELTFRD